jgi:hypothetical protein
MKYLNQSIVTIVIMRSNNSNIIYLHLGMTSNFSVAMPNSELSSSVKQIINIILQIIT